MTVSRIRTEANSDIFKAFKKSGFSVSTTRQFCTKWKITFSTITRPRFTADFINGLTMLDEASNGDEAERKEAYIRFTKHFGTHHLVQASYGASIYIHLIVKTESGKASKGSASLKSADWGVGGCLSGKGGDKSQWQVELCLRHQHNNSDANKEGASSSRAFQLSDVLISAKGSHSLSLADFHAEDSDIMPVRIKVAAVQELINEDYLSQNEEYGFERSLDAKAINGILEEGVGKWYCDGVLGLTPEECKEEPGTKVEVQGGGGEVGTSEVGSKRT